MMNQVLHWGDYISLILYFVLVIGFGIWSSRSSKNRESVGGYFLAGRSMHFIPVGASLFASNIGSGHFLGLAGSGAASGIGIAGFESAAPFIIILLGWIFLPVYIRAGVYTMPEYLQRRFGGDRIRIYLSILSLLLYITTKISADLYSGALFIKMSFNIDLYLSTVVLLVISAFFTIAGGLSAVIWTDFIQTIIMLIGAFYLMAISFLQIGGFQKLKHTYSYAVPSTTLYSNTTCGLPRADYFNLVRGVNSDYPWTGMLFGFTSSAIWYWCSDQVIVQRALAAKNLTHAKAGCLVAGLLKFLPLFFLVLPGMAARVLFKDEVACADPATCKAYCGSETGCSNLAYPRMVINLMPVGARGLMLAVMMAALMSSLTSVFNSASAIFTMDVWKRVRTRAKDWELMIVSRLFILILAAFSILWIPIIQASQGSRLFDYIQSITSYLAPPLCAIFVLAVFVKRINEKGAFWGLFIGLIIGMVRFVYEYSYTVPPCAKRYLDKRPAIISKVHYLHFRIILFVITMFISWVVSIMTKPIPDKYIDRLTYFTIYSPNEPLHIPSDKGVFNKGICTGADLDSDNEEEKNIEKDDETEETLAKPQQIEEIVKDNILKKLLFWICGMEVYMRNRKTRQMKQAVKIDTSIDEDKHLSFICDICAILMFALCGFIFGFFNKFD